MAVAAPRARAAAGALSAPSPPRTAPRARERAQARPALTPWVLWIAVVGVLLAGIVALNVAALQLRMERGRLQSGIVELRAENARVQAELSTAAGVGRVVAIARGGLGLVQPSETTYLKLERRRR